LLTNQHTVLLGCQTGSCDAHCAAIAAAEAGGLTRNPGARPESA
jgi:hypothetical protein